MTNLLLYFFFFLGFLNIKMTSNNPLEDQNALDYNIGKPDFISELLFLDFNNPMHILYRVRLRVTMMDHIFFLINYLIIIIMINFESNRVFFNRELPVRRFP